MDRVIIPTADPATAARRWRGLFRLFDWRRAVVCIPRRLCHHVTLDVRNIPRRHLANSLRLRLTHLTGIERTGFVYRLHRGNVQVWYWDETDIDAFRAALPQGGGEVHGIAPWPEPLLRAMPSEGLHLLIRGQGCEAVAVRDGEIRRSRWFRTLPDDADWAVFVRDAGQDPATCPRPPAFEPPPLARPGAGWKRVTRLVEPVPLPAWLAAALAALLGAALIAGGIYEFKLTRLIESERAEIARIRSENATTLALHRELSEAGAYLAALDRMLLATPQLELMRAIAEAGLIDDPYRISLLEWEYRGDRLRLLFAVPTEGFSLGGFLAKLEKLPYLTAIRLMPDTPYGTVGIQAEVKPPVPQRL